MSDREPTKVYELAKELGIDSISLVDKLKTLEINVKNHMSELSDSDVERARSVLKAGSMTASSASAKTAAKKTATTATATGAKKVVAKRAAGASETTGIPTKAAPAKTAGAEGKTEAKAVAKPAAKAAVRKKPAAADSSTVVSTAAAREAAAAAAAAATSSSTIIRRRLLSDGATQTVTSTISTTTGEEEGQLASAPHAEVPQANEGLETSAQPADEEKPAPRARASMLSTSPSPSLNVAPQAPAVSPESGDAEESTEAVEAAPTTTESVRTEVKTAGGKTTTSIIRRTEITTLTTSSVKDGMPRAGSLRIIEQPKPAPKPTPRGLQPSKPGLVGAGTGADKKPGFGPIPRDGFKFGRVDKENLDKMAEEEARKRGPKAFETEIKPEDVKFSDYRKKEMIFIPKRKKAPVGRSMNKTELTTSAAHKRVVEMGDHIILSDLANQMQVKSNEVIKKLMMMGTMATMNQSLDFDTATLIAQEFQHEVKNIAFKETELLQSDVEADADLKPRPPVVTIMGHVDHGKTTLLDAIREADVAGGEAGGITQHIGAYSIVKDGKKITFIDTPGHEAFTSMRARGANVTDIVILVVSADDGVMPQTREALSHAKAAEVPIIVAVNKIDKPGANPEKIKQSLADLDLLPEDWGGQTMYIPVSALKKTNIDKLLDAILLTAEVEDLKANPDGLARGAILEARLEKGRGPVATVLVNRGTLHQGDIVVSGVQWGRVRAMTNHLGQLVKDISPGMAVEILGLDGIPSAGDQFDAVESERAATTLVSHRVQANRDSKAKSSKSSLEDLFARSQAGDVKELRVVLKADVFGSVEAVRESLLKQTTEKVKVRVIHSGTGGITESDVMLANASDAIIIGFNVRPETKARQIAEAEHVEIKSYSIIYELLDEVKAAMGGLLDKKKVETYLGRAEVRQTFSIPKAGTIAGCFVVDGKLIRNAQIRLLRDSRIMYDGKLDSLKRFKDDAKEVAQGYECGMSIDGFNDIKVGDLIEAYQIDMIAQTL
jgi:translation initiation factor IF-2